MTVFFCAPLEEFNKGLRTLLFSFFYLFGDRRGIKFENIKCYTQGTIIRFEIIDLIAYKVKITVCIETVFEK